MNTFLQLAVSGVAIGSVYGLVALGFLIIFHTTGLVNFAQGQILMVGAMSTYLFLMSLGWSYWLVIPAVVIVGVLLTVVFRWGLYEPLRRRNATTYATVVATIAFGLALSEAAGLFIGNTAFGVDAIVPGKSLAIVGLSLRPQSVIVLVVAWVMVGLVWLFFNRTLLGLQLRAVSLNHTAAQVSGVRVSRLITIGFGLSIIVTVVAGMLIAPLISASPNMGLALAVKGFAAAVLGGMSSVYRGMVAGVVIGVIELLSSYYISSAYAPAIAYALLFVALVILPGRVRGRQLS